jgi:hypothetical protein
MLAELYWNTLNPDHKSQIARYWVIPNRILAGGSIVDKNDYRHLVADFGVAGVLSVETEHRDTGKGIPCLVELPFPDNGTAPDRTLIRNCIEFGRACLWAGPGVLYVHCQQGRFRSPAIAYGIAVMYGSDRQDVRKNIQSSNPNFGGGVYLETVESVLKEMESP